MITYMTRQSIRKILISCAVLFYALISWSQSEITSAELSAHVKFLASDSLKGRKPGTNEFTVAAKYVANEFKKYGLKLLGDNGFQYFEVAPEIEVGKNTLKAGKTDFKYGTDFTVFSYSKSAKIKSGLIFAGYGFDIQNNKMIWNDYSRLIVKGKWVMILRGSPEKNREDNFYENNIRDLEKINIAKAKGAAGVILVSPVDLNSSDELLPLKYEGAKKSDLMPVIQVKRSVANQLILKSGKSIENLEKELNTKLMPVSFDTKSKVEIKTDVQLVPVKTENIIGYLEGSDHALKSQYLVIGAHLDHLGFGGPGSGSRKQDTVAIHNGADDNASGVATILELAQYLASKKDSLKRSVLFIAFSGEELGLLGSQFYVNNPLLDLNNAKAMLNFDMVGRFNNSTRAVTLSGTGTAKEWEDILDQYQKQYNFKFNYSKEGYGSSDHSSFYSRNIPVIHFFTDLHDDYHTPSDDAELLNYHGQQEVTELAARLAFQLLNRNSMLTYQEAGSKERKSSSANLKVTLGIMPGFGSTDGQGLKVEGVTKDKPAYKAGIQVGDIITALNGEKIADIYEYMDKLKKFKPGDKITANIRRGDNELVVNIEF